MVKLSLYNRTKKSKQQVLLPLQLGAGILPIITGLTTQMQAELEQPEISVILPYIAFKKNMK